VGVTGETIHFGNMEFIADHFNNLGLSRKGDDSGAIFVGIADSRSPSLHGILEESTCDDESATSEGGSSSFPIFLSWFMTMI
jgi:hypothetical protein